MGIIEQTNRTILFDVINPEVFDMFNIMSDVDENSKSLSDEKVAEINNALLVNNFDEFLRKFKPTIYSYFDQERGMVYELTKPAGIPEPLVKKIVIDRNNTFLKMFISIMDSKKASGATNASFNYEKVTEMLAPHKTLKEIKKLKKDITYLENKNAEFESDSPAKQDAVLKLKAKLERTKKYYNETSSQLTLMLGMIKDNLDTAVSAAQKGVTEFNPALPVFNENAEIVALGVQDNPASLLEDKGKGNESTELANAAKGEVAVTAASEKKTISYKDLSVAVIEEQYNESMQALYESVGQEYDTESSSASLSKELIVAAFTDKVPDKLVAMDIDTKVELYNKYSAINTLWQKSFIRTAKLLIERILSVKAFFDQYQPKSPFMRPSLLVVNAPMSDILEEKNLENLKKYLETVNNKSDYSNTIWFGIVPNIEYSDEREIDIDEDTMRQFGYTGDIYTGVSIMPTPVSDLQVLLDAIKDYRIQVFFSFETGEDTTFLKLSTHGMDQYMENTQELENADYSRYAIPSLPNFTVIPSNKSRVVLGSKAIRDKDGKLQFSTDRDDFMKFWIYGVYIGAAYVAAGIAAAYQCPNFLSAKFGGKVKKEYPGVRFDIEAGDNALYVTTTMPKEIAGYTTETKNIINEHKYGFVFSSDKNQLNGNSINLVTVYKSRCMNESKNGGFESIFRETTRTYLYRMIGALTSDYKKDRIDKIFESGGKVKEWQLSPNYVNSILREGDGIEKGDCNDTTYNIEINFAGVSENMELQINTD
ncbi:MAG: hypothetical protein K1W39_01610 [Lachnospiraceae bacterium]|jgi:hypothetical protein